MQVKRTQSWQSFEVQEGVACAVKEETGWSRVSKRGERIEKVFALEF